MKNPINDIASGMQQLQENQDGTLKGGFLSITGGRYRIILGMSSANMENSNCTNTIPESSGGCCNDSCSGSDNTLSCHNGCRIE